MATKAVSLTSPTDVDTQAIQRRRAMAEALQQESMAPVQAASYNGIQAPISWTQGLAKVLQGYNARQDIDKADTDAKALLGQQQERRGADMSALIGALQGRKATPGGLEEDASGNVTEMPAQPALTQQQSLQRVLPMLQDPAVQQAGMGLMLEQAKKGPGDLIGKLEPKDYTPESWGQFLQTGNTGTLRQVTKAPEMKAAPRREVIKGSVLVQEEMKPDGTWQQIGTGPRFASQLNPGEQGGKPPVGYRWKGDGELEKIPGGPADKPNERSLPPRVISDLVEAGGLADGTSRSLNTFNDQFAGKTLTGDLSNTYGRIMGDDTGQSQWWQDYSSQNNVKRNKLFGSALTATEKGEWEKTIVTPRMDPKEVRKNLTRQAELEAKAARKLAAPYLSAGYSREQIEGALGIPLDVLGATPGAKPAPTGDPLGIRKPK